MGCIEDSGCKFDSIFDYFCGGGVGGGAFCCV